MLVQLLLVEYLNNTMTLQKNSLINAAKKIFQLGLNKGSSGNLSLRIEKNKYLITSSGCSLENLQQDDIVTMSTNGSILHGKKPSSEWRIHSDLYNARDDIDAVIHTHSKYACVLACLHRELPSFHYMVAVAGGENIRCCPYALFGTNTLSNYVIEAMKDRSACLMANHGLIVGSSRLSHAIYIADEVESLCEQYVNALSVGEVKLLTKIQMKKVLEKFKNYGTLGKEKND